MVAESAANFLDPSAYVRRIGEAAAGNVDLIDVERPAVDEGTERLTATFALAGGDWYWRAIAQPDVALDVILPERLLEPFGGVFGDGMGTAQCRAGVVDATGVDQQRVFPKT